MTTHFNNPRKPGSGHPKPGFLFGLSLLALGAGPSGARAGVTQAFRFQASEVNPSATEVKPEEAYTDQRGYGYEGGPKAAGSPEFSFSVAEPEGDYEVTVRLGDLKRPAVTTVRSELRRLMVLPVPTEAGEFKTVRFTVNLRRPQIDGDTVVRLKPREKTGEFIDWDNKLTLQFDGPSAAVDEIDIAPATPVTTVYLAGDSTMCDQPYEPFSSWGQVIPAFFRDGVAVANHAESGESAHSFIGERRLAKLKTLLKQGDFLLIQFGHNDQKEKGEGMGPYANYQRDLLSLVSAARDAGATPILVTSVSRRTFGQDGRIHSSFGDYLPAMKELAAREKVAVIDLNQLSAELYEAYGPEKVKQLFPTVRGSVEGTHHDDFGSFEIAKCVVEGIRTGVPDLARYLKPDVAPFDPRKPDAPEGYSIPATPKATMEVPYGN